MKHIIAVLACAGCLLSATVAFGGVGEGRLRVGLDTTFLRFGTGQVDFDHGNGHENGNDFDAMTFGVALSRPSLVIGYAVTDGLVLGGRLHLGVEGYDDSNQDNSAFQLGALFFVEYVFLDGVVRPFVTGQVGIENQSEGLDDQDGWWWAFAFAGGGGIHIFPIDRVSLDFTGLIGFRAGSGEWGDHNDFSHWRFNVGLLFGISGWFL